MKTSDSISQKTSKKPPFLLENKGSRSTFGYSFSQLVMISPFSPCTTPIVFARCYTFLQGIHCYTFFSVIKGSSVSCINLLRIQLLPSTCKTHNNEWNSIRVKLFKNTVTKPFTIQIGLVPIVMLLELTHQDKAPNVRKLNSHDR